MAAFEKACDKAEDAKSRRQEKREKKRQRLRLTTRSIFGQDSSSEDDVSPISKRNSSYHEPGSPNSDTLFVNSNEHLPAQSTKPTMSSALAKPPLVPRRAPLEQSSSDSESSDSERSSGNICTKSASTKTRKTKGQTANESRQGGDNHRLGNSILQRTSSEHKNHASSNPVVNEQSSSALTTMSTQAPRGAPIAPKAMLQRPNSPGKPNSQGRNVHAAVPDVSRPTAAPRNATITSASTGSRPATLSTTTAPRKSSNPNTAIRTSSKGTVQAVRKTSSGTQAPGPIKFVDQPRAQRKEWQSDKLYSTLKYRYNAAKRSQIEKTPDVGSLAFVNGPPAGLPTTRNPIRTDNPYGRRDIPESRTRDDDVHEDPFQKDFPRRSPDITIEPLAQWEADKVPVVCSEWRLSNSCSFGAQKCRYMHRDRDPQGKEYPIGDMYGYVEPKNRSPAGTCMFWYKSKCHKSADVCAYAHKFTGYTFRGSKMVPIEPNDKANENTKQSNEKTKQSKGKSKYPNERAHPNTLTCWFWKHTSCRKTTEECSFCHYDTDNSAADPRTRTAVSSVNQIEVQPRISAGASNDTPGKSLAPTGSHYTTAASKREEVSIKPPDREYGDDLPADHAASSLDVKMTGTDSLESYMQQPSGLVQQPTTSLISQESPAMDTEPNLMTCLALKASIEQACRLDFTDMFSIDINEGEVALAKRAFLVFHPEAHAAEIDLITRWLLMHHVAVSNTWYDGAWNYFREQTMESESGIVIVSSEKFRFFNVRANYIRCIPTSSISVRCQGLVIFSAKTYVFGLLECNLVPSSIPPRQNIRPSCVTIALRYFRTADSSTLLMKSSRRTLGWHCKS
jgi:chromo domain-containing protein 1